MPRPPPPPPPPPLPPPPRGVDGGGENSRIKGHDPYIPPGDGRNEGMPGKNDGGNEPTPYQQGKGEQSWEQQFQDIQQLHSDSGSMPPITKPNMKLSLPDLTSPTPWRLIN